MFKGTKISPGGVLPDGTIPAILMDCWALWVQDCVSLLDGDGAFRHWKYSGAYADQPWIDLQIYQVIRSRWVELRNDDTNKKYKNMASTLAPKRGGKIGRGLRKRR